MRFVITVRDGVYEGSYDRPVAVCDDFIQARDVAQRLIELPGDNWVLETYETVYDEVLNCYTVKGVARSIVLPRLRKPIWGPVIWGVD